MNGVVLVVEDEAIIREPLQAALVNAGYEVDTASDAASALESMNRRTPDLVLLDMKLPGASGLTVLNRIRTNDRFKNLPVLMLSAIAEKELVVKAVQMGISGYMLKSRFSLEEMLQRVAEHLAAPEQRLGGVAATPPPAPTQVSSPVPTQVNPPAKAVEPAQAPTPTASADPALPQAQAASAATAESLVPVINDDDDPMEVLKSLKPIMTRSEITARVEGGVELKGLSPAVSQVLRLTGADRCSIEQVAKAISQDHAIALKVLKLANSAVYTRGEPVDSVQLAVSRIGLGQIRQTVLNLSVIDQFDAQSAGSAIDFGQFWEHAIAVGIIAAELAYALEQDVDSAFTMGLLHDVGRMFFADQFGELYGQVLEVAAKLKLPVEQVESRMLLFNHADVMDRVLHGWKFPKQLINPIVFHHLSAGNIRRSAPRQIVEVAMLGLANRLAHAMMLGSSGNESIYPTNDLCEMLKLDASVIEDVRSKARDETDKVKFALLATSSTANWPQLREVHRQALGEPLRPIYVSTAPQYDACRLFVDELATLDEGESPNIGIIHITNPRDRVPLTSAYRTAEAEAGVSDLPLLVLSPAGKLLPETSLTANRTVQTLATPFVVPAFTSAVRDLTSAGAVPVAAAA